MKTARRIHLPPSKMVSGASSTPYAASSTYKHTSIRFYMLTNSNTFTKCSTIICFATDNSKKQPQEQ